MSEAANQTFQEYEEKPRIVLFYDDDRLELRDGIYYFTPDARHKLDGISKIAPEHVFDLFQPTVEGLLQDLIPGTALADQFYDYLQDSNEPKDVWVFYPENRDLVRLAKPFWHRTALLTRNSFLLRDPKMEKSWNEIRKIFDESVVAVAGCSVGSNITHALIRDMRPNHIKIADFYNYKLTNANRVFLTYRDFGKNKARVTAKQIHAIDPFMGISVYTEGVHNGNAVDFLSGNQTGEPKTTLLVEEVDNPEIKIMLREVARKNRIPVVMATDLGSAVQIDIRRFDLNGQLSLVPFTRDADLYAAFETWKKDMGDRQKLFEFYYSMIGRKSEARLPELSLVIWRKIPLPFGGVPQLGSTAMAAGGFAAEIAARILLGWSDLPERMMVVKHTFEVLIDREGGL